MDDQRTDREGGSVKNITDWIVIPCLAFAAYDSWTHGEMWTVALLMFSLCLISYKIVGQKGRQKNKNPTT
jgi:hypothetical protein